MEHQTTSIWMALNPAVYLISILPGLAVFLVSDHSQLWMTGLVAATFAVTLLQHAINVFNDLSDWKLGADVEKMDSWVRAQGQNMKAVAIHGSLSFLAGGLLGLFILHISNQYWILTIAAPLVFLGYLYNSGAKPLSYSRAGEWVTGICYGPGVFGCLWLVDGNSIDFIWLSGSIAFAALSLSLLLSHQPPQIETDRAAGKLSFAVRHGATKTYLVSRILFMVSNIFLCLSIYLARVKIESIIGITLVSLVLTIALFKLKIKPPLILVAYTVLIVFSAAIV